MFVQLILLHIKCSHSVDAREHASTEVEVLEPLEAPEEGCVRNLALKEARIFTEDKLLQEGA